MRFARLDLIRYGRFADRSLEFPAREVDLHLIAGPNEAGKSTAKSAIADLLFGFGHTTRFDFLHESKLLRIGALLEREGTQLEARRRKGRQDTLRTPLEEPLAETAVQALLGATDREFFERMFSLDHERLIEGGRQILSAKDDVGRLLFEAGSGLASLREILAGLTEDADKIFGTRRAANRTFYQAMDQIVVADQRLREVSVSARQWVAARDEVAALHEKRAASDGALRDEKRQCARLQRVRRVRTILVGLKRAEEELSELGEALLLPVNLAEDLAVAEKDLAGAKSQLEALDEQIKTSEDELSALVVDEALLAREDEIEVASKLRMKAESARADIPRRQENLAAVTKQIDERLIEIGRTPHPLERVEQALPARAKVVRLRDLLEGHGAVATASSELEKGAARAANEVERLKRTLGEAPQVPPAPALAGLATAIREARARVDLPAGLHQIDLEVTRRARRLATSLEALRPWQGSIEALRDVVAPSAVLIGEFRDRFALQSQREMARQAEQEAVEKNLAIERQALLQAVRDRGAIAREVLDEARRHRDLGWQLVRRRHVAQEPLTDEEIERFTAGGPLVPRFEESLAKADEVADQRFAGARDSALLIEIQQRIERLDLERSRLTEEQAKHVRERALLQSDWCALWSTPRSTPGLTLEMTPESPERMAEWIKERVAALALDDEQAEARARIAKLREDASESRRVLEAALDATGTTGKHDASAPLGRFVDEAEARNEAFREAERNRKSLRTQLEKAQAKLDLARQEAEQASHALGVWSEAWNVATERAGLAAGEKIESVREILPVLEELPGALKEARDLGHRIVRMQEDVADFERAAGTLEPLLPPSVKPRSADQVIEGLTAALQASRSGLARRQAAEKRRADQRERRNQKQLDAAKAESVIAHFLKLGQCADIVSLRAAIERADRRRALATQREQQLIELAKQADGETRATLEAHCGAADHDGLVGEIEALETHIDAINGELRTLGIEVARAEASLARIAGGTEAVHAAEQRQSALARMQEESQRYVRLFTAARLLRWAIDRYRKEKQGPLLARAGALFSKLTAGGFDGLRIDLDENGQPCLVGLRGAEQVGLEGMSEGSVDQLFLSLRLAAIDEHLARSPALPFVADDLFINFDDQRAAAGFRALADLARRTQVLFFTHHEHLVEVARAALRGGDLSVQRL